MKWLVAFLFLTGCSSANSEWEGTIETLPNGAVRVSNPAQGVWEAATAWRLVPDLIIGDVDGTEATTFAAITGLEADDAGRIYVLDRQANQLRIFGSDGSHVRSVGRSGSGPGEYTNANGLRWTGPDTLVVVDQRGNRYSVLTGDGEYVRSVARGLGFYGWAFAGGYDNGKIYERYTVGRQSDARPVLLGTSLRLPAPEPPASARAGATQFGATSPDTVYLPKPTGSLYESFSVQTSRGGMVMAVPFTSGPVYYLDARGSVWHGHGSEFRIVRSTLKGDTLLEIALHAAPAPVTPGELEEWQSQEAVTRFKEMGGTLELGRIPASKPYFDDLHVDQEGYLWVSVPAGPNETTFAVFDDQGRYMGRLNALGLKRETFVPPVVRNRKLYVVGRDELDVQRVYVFRIEGR